MASSPATQPPFDPGNSQSLLEIQRWRDFFEELGSSAWVWNLDTDAVEFTSTWLRSMGYASDAISTGNAWFRLIHPDDAQAVQKETNLCIHAKKPQFDREFRFRRADSSYAWIHSRAKVVEVGEPTRTRFMFGLYTDVSSQRADKEKLTALESRWNHALKGSNLGVWELDLNSGRGYWSPELQRMTKTNHLEIEPDFAFWREMLSPEDQVRNSQLYEQYLNGEINEYRAEYLITCGDGTKKWVLSRATISARDSSGKPTRLTGTLDDISVRKQHEEQIAASSERIRKITATIPGFVYEYHLRADGTHLVPYVSEGIKDIYGVEPAMVSEDGSAVFNAIHPEDRQKVTESILQSAQTGEGWRLNYRVFDTSGNLKWLRGIASCQKLQDGSGSAVWHGYISDISEEVDFQNQLEQIMQLVPGAIFQYQRWPDGRHCFPFTTDKISAFFGATPAQLAENADHAFEKFVPEDRAHISKVFRTCLKERGGWDEEYRVVLNGETQWHRSVANISQNENSDGSLIWNGYISDVTLHKDRELEISRQNELINQVTSTVPGVIYQYVIYPDNHLEIPFISHGVKEIFGVSRESALQNPASLWTYIHPDDRQRLIDEVSKSVDLDIEYRILLPSVGERWRRAIASCVAGASGEYHYYAYVLDVTKDKQIELAMEQQSKAIELANEDLEQFNYVAAHDLKEPLRGIKHLSEWIEEDLEGQASESVVGNLAKMRKRVSRLQLLVDDLAAYSRAGRQNQETRLVNLRGLISRIIGEISDNNFTFNFDGVEDYDIETVEIALETVFKNLIMNAMTHHDKPTGGSVNITANVGDTHLLCRVEDNGPGIPPEHHERVFKMYQQLNPSQNPTGSGSGLAIVRRIVAAANAKIVLESPITDDGHGTRFILTWPIRWPNRK